MSEAIFEYQQEIDRLKARVEELEEQIEFLRRHSLLTKGMRGETLISSIVGGQLTTYAASHDVETKNGERIEVKHSTATKTNKRSVSQKWQWNKILGEGGKKDFDYLILVGDADLRYRSSYLDPFSPYVLFCFPRSEVEAISKKTEGTRYRSIQLGTNPHRLISKTSRLIYDRYQVTDQEVTDRFGVL